MTPLRVAVADDEPLARELLVEMLGRDPEVEVVATCGSGDEVLAAVHEHHPDIVFLDIEMPESDGLDVAAALADQLPDQARPTVVYVTAYEHHALRAFELEALDYLLKPFSDCRFQATLERAKRESRRGAEAVPSATHERLALREQGRVSYVAVSEVRWIEAADYCSRIHTDNGSRLVRRSLRSFETSLGDPDFVRVHRGALVRLSAVRALHRPRHGTWHLELDDGVRVPVSRARRRIVAAGLDPKRRRQASS